MKIEKCPFCGKQIAEISNCKELEGCRHFESCPATEPYVCVVCNMFEGGCGASSGYYDSEEKAIAAWNSRADAVPVVRCGECKHYNKTCCSKGFGWCEKADRGVFDDFYCADGREREEKEKCLDQSSA